MKKFIYLLSSLIVLISCSKDLDDGFNDANPNVKKKFLHRVEIISDENELEGTNTFNYDSNNKLTSITNGSESQFFNYNESGDLISSTGSEDYFVSDLELNGAPFDAYEWGDVLEYDDKENPIKIELLKNDFGFGYNNKVCIAHISYDDKPNPRFYTLEAAGIINLLNTIDLDFGYTPKELIKARELIPYNSMNTIIIKNLDGQTESEIHFENTYDEDDYLTRSNVLVISENETFSTYFRYYYKNNTEKSTLINYFSVHPMSMNEINLNSEKQ